MNELQAIDENIWMVDGPEVSFYGFPYPTRMVVIKLEDGLWIWSPIELTEALESAVRELGEVKWVVTPNKLHHLFVEPWLEAFPQAAAFAPPGLAQKRSDIAFHADLGDMPEPAWSPDIDQIIVHGSPALEEVLFFHRPSSTCLVGDLIQRHDPEAFHGWKRSLMKLDGMVGEHGSTPREWRAGFIHRDEGREALKKALAWNPRRLIIAHGECAMEDGVHVLEDGLRWLNKPWPV